MKSEKLDLNSVNQSDFGAVAKAVENSLPKDAILLDKHLLPSRGRYYPEDIYVKKLSTLNIKNLSTINEKNANYIINSTISSCVLNIDTNKILVGDKLWFIFYLRALTYDDLPFQIKHKCEHCENTVNLEFTLKNLKVDYLDKDVPAEFITEEGDKIKTRFPTIGMEAVTNRMKNGQDSYETFNEDLLEFAVNIESVNGKRMDIYNAYQYVANMDAKSFSKLVNEMTNYMFTVRPYAEFVCPDCKETVAEKVPFSPSFFLPKL